MNKLMLSLLLGASVLGFQAVAMDLDDDDIHCTPMSTQSTAPQLVSATQPLRNRLSEAVPAATPQIVQATQPWRSRLSEAHLQWLKNNWRGHPSYEDLLSGLSQQLIKKADLSQPPSFEEFAKIPVDSLRALAPLAAQLCKFSNFTDTLTKIAVLCLLSRVPINRATILERDTRRLLGFLKLSSFLRDNPYKIPDMLVCLLANGGQRLKIIMREAHKIIHKGMRGSHKSDIIAPLVELQDSRLLCVIRGAQHIFEKMKLQDGLKSSIIRGLASIRVDGKTLKKRQERERRIVVVGELAPQVLSNNPRDSHYNTAVFEAAGELKAGLIQEAATIFKNDNYSFEYQWVLLKVLKAAKRLPHARLHSVMSRVFKVMGYHAQNVLEDGKCYYCCDNGCDYLFKFLCSPTEHTNPLFRKKTSLKEKAKISEVLRKAPHDRVAALRAFAPSLEVIDEDNRAEVIKSLLEVPAERIPVVYRDAQDLFSDYEEGRFEPWIFDLVVSSTPDKILVTKKYAPILIPAEMDPFFQIDVLRALIDTNEEQLALVAEYAPKLCTKEVSIEDDDAGSDEASIIQALCAVPMDLIPRITKYLLKDPKRLNDSGDKIGDLIKALAEFPPERWDFISKHFFDYVHPTDPVGLNFIHALKGLPLERMQAIHDACSQLKAYIPYPPIGLIRRIPADRLLKVVCEAPKLFASGWDPHNARMKIIKALSQAPKAYISPIAKYALTRITDGMDNSARAGVIKQIIRALRSLSLKIHNKKTTKESLALPPNDS